MNALVWLLRSLIEPVFWSALQWIWSLDVSSNSATWDLYLYGYSSTNVRLWMYEKCSPLVTLLVFIIGLCTTVVFAASVVRLLVKAVSRVLLFLCRQVISRVVVNFVQVITVAFMRCIHGTAALFSRFTSSKADQRETLQPSSLHRDRAPLCSEDNTSFQGRKEADKRVVPIDPAAFRPRRSKSGRGRRQDQ